MIDEIDYFPKRDKYKKKKGGDSTDEWDALKKVKTSQNVSKGKSQKDSEKKGNSGNKMGQKPEK